MNIFSEFQNFICSKVLPLVYDESLSYLEINTKLINYVNEMIKSVNDVITAHNDLTGHYAETLQQLALLKADIEKMKTGFYIKDGTITLKQMNKEFLAMIQDYVSDTVKELVSFVWFGLNDNGHFIAVIPSSWSQIIFSTDTDGNLVLSY